MMPFCACMSGGFQFRVIDSDVVASKIKFSGGMLGATKCESAKEEYFMMKHKQKTDSVHNANQLIDCNPNSKNTTFRTITFLNYVLNTCYL